MVAHESGITKSVDLLGGSYALESITGEIEKKVFELITKIDHLGGAVNCIENGYIQKELANEAYKHQTSIENNEKIIVGVNEFKEEQKNSISIFKQDGTSEKKTD
ncbi:Methylmalonyl-CoA mutase [subsurface metagenome]